MSLSDFFSWLGRVIRRTPDVAPPALPAPAPAPSPVEPAPTCILCPLIDEMQAFVGPDHPIIMAALEFIEETVDDLGEPFCAALERTAMLYLTVKHPLIAPVLLPLLRASKPASAGQNGAGGPDTVQPAGESNATSP